MIYYEAAPQQTSMSKIMLSFSAISLAMKEAVNGGLTKWTKAGFNRKWSR